MALTKYKQKRAFNKTPEPTGGKVSGKELRFVIQKHDASRLHYDFRLEMEGVLKSWAVPKGPSLNPTDKRLAMMVEDHPYDYRNFEGIIPAGNYGAGTVIVWDEGTYEPLNPSGDKKTDEKALLKQLKAGSLKFSLHGQKLQGEFALVRLKNGEGNAWLLIKHRDKYAKETDITRKVRSVVSDQTLEEVAKTSHNIYGSKPARKSAATPGSVAKPKKVANPKKVAKKTADQNAAAKKSTTTKTVVKKNATAKKAAVSKADVEKAIAAPAATNSKRAARKKKVLSIPAEAPRSKFPKEVSPMLATLVNKPFDEEGWLYEIKWDGYRAIGFCNGSSVELLSRNKKSFNDKFYPVHKALVDWNVHAVVDGEVCVLNNEGIAHFGSLQNWRSEADGALMYYVFDLLWLDGHDLRELPLTERRALLKAMVPATGIIRLSENFESDVSDFLAAATKLGLEGIIAKKADSAYIEGDRSREWLKIKSNKRHEVVIGGYTNNEDSVKPFSSLLVGVYQDGKLHYTGKIGTGFNVKQQKEMMAAFRPLVTTKIPFAEEPDVNKPSRFRPNPPHATVTWLKPSLVCEVSYAEITSDGVMRHPSFEGMREDKKAKSVVEETAVATEVVLAGEKPTKKHKALSAKMLRSPDKRDRKTLLNPTEATQVKEIHGHALTFSNLNKIYWPDEKYTKRDMLNYYYLAAPFMLPYLKDRPQSLNRYPNGINGKSFYQKDVTGKVPSWIKLYPYHTSDGEDKHFMVPQSEEDILWMANAGAIEMNPWNSTTHKPDHPDWCCLDIDPDKKNTFEQVIEVARVIKTVLDDMGITGYPKTSGSTGIHIYIPLGAKYTYDECQLFGKLIAMHTHDQLPTFTSIERMTKNRKGKIYIDYLQNRAKATLAAPYSLRPKPGATVSMPLHWEEVQKGLTMKDFTILNAMDRIKEVGDIFKPVLGKGINLKVLLKKLNKQED